MLRIILIPAGCPDPGEVSNAQRTDTDVFTTTTVVLYECNAGFRLNGASALTCLSTGQWSAPRPTCQSGSLGTYP